MPELRSITRQKPTSVTIDLGDGDTVLLVFDRNKVTPAWAAEAQRRANELQDVMSLSHALAEVTISWDVTDDGQAFPPTGENIGVLSYGAQKALMHEIMVAAVPSDAEGKALPVPLHTPSSASEEQPQIFPNGAATSASPAPSASPSPT